jgi:hypothetical protein
MDLAETVGQPAAPAVAIGFKPGEDLLVGTEQLSSSSFFDAARRPGHSGAPSRGTLLCPRRRSSWPGSRNWKRSPVKRSWKTICAAMNR